MVTIDPQLKFRKRLDGKNYKRQTILRQTMKKCNFNPENKAP